MPDNPLHIYIPAVTVTAKIKFKRTKTYAEEGDDGRILEKGYYSYDSIVDMTTASRSVPLSELPLGSKIKNCILSSSVISSSGGPVTVTCCGSFPWSAKSNKKLKSYLNLYNGDFSTAEITASYSYTGNLSGFWGQLVEDEPPLYVTKTFTAKVDCGAQIEWGDSFTPDPPDPIDPPTGDGKPFRIEKAGNGIGGEIIAGDASSPTCEIYYPVVANKGVFMDPSAALVNSQKWAEEGLNYSEDYDDYDYNVPVSYCKDTSNVYLKGWAAGSDTPGSVIATMPEGYRPIKDSSLMCRIIGIQSGSTITKLVGNYASIVIDTTGKIVFKGRFQYNQPSALTQANNIVIDISLQYPYK